MGDADAAFRLYAEMRANKVQTEVKVYGALISACNQEALAAGGGRRQVPAAMTPRDSTCKLVCVLCEILCKSLHSTLLTAWGGVYQLYVPCRPCDSQVGGSSCKWPV